MNIYGIVREVLENPAQIERLICGRQPGLFASDGTELIIRERDLRAWIDERARNIAQVLTDLDAQAPYRGGCDCGTCRTHRRGAGQ